MQLSELTFEVRDSTLARVGQLQPQDLISWKSTLLYNQRGSWEITLPVGHHLGEVLRLPGSGIIVTHISSGVILSGPTTSATVTKSQDDVQGHVLISGVDDTTYLWERLCYPTPTSADVTTQGSYDSRTGLASTLMYGYVKSNIGALAPAARKISSLGTSTDAGIGSTVSYSARYDVLGKVLQEIANVSSPQLGFDIVQAGSSLEFQVFQPRDLSKQIRMDVSNDTLKDSEYAYGLPNGSVTTAIVGGGGELAGRTMAQVETADSIAAKNLWGRRVETFVDQRQTTSSTELTQAGKDKLVTSSSVTSIKVTPSSDTTMRYGFDFGLGDIVGVVIDSQEVSAQVTSVGMVVTESGVYLSLTVGTPFGVDYDSLINKKQVETARRVADLELQEKPNGSTVSYNLDGGKPDSNYGGSSPITGGTP